MNACAVLHDKTITLLIESRTHEAAWGGAVAAILGDGSVVTGGHPVADGDSSATQDELKTVQQIQASDSAFAAILGDGSVVTWGDAAFGGDSTVQGQLKYVQQIQAAVFAFAAVLGDGSVVTWGAADPGGDSSASQDQLQNVQSRSKLLSVLLLPFLAMDLS